MTTFLRRQLVSKAFAVWLIIGRCAALVSKADGDYEIQVLHDFQSGRGVNLIAASSGGFFGTTFGQPGSVFRATTSGFVATLVSFGDADGRGTDPGDLTQGGDGKLYGTTVFGKEGNGSVFQIGLDGIFKELFVFSGTNGARPWGRLLLAEDDNLYGTTYSGGAHGVGAVFRISTAGDGFTNLYHFTGRADGYQPLGGFVETADGMIYGSTSLGGSDGGGTIFRLTHSGELTTLLPLNSATGSGFVFLTLAKNGGIYGTAGQDGAHGRGTLFTLTPPDKLSVLASFSENDGSFPTGLVEATDGSFYGATEQGSKYGNGMGTIFKFTRESGLTTLAHFDGTNGTRVIRQLALGSDGNVYGVTEAGGRFGNGTLFRLVKAPRLTLSPRVHGSISFQWDSFPGGKYRLEQKVHLTDPTWQTVVEVVGSGNFTTFTNSLTGASEAYFRLVLAP